MSVRRLKFIYFCLEGVNSFATTYFFYYLFFHLRDQFHFGSAQNLAVCALQGLVYTVCAWFGGRFSQRAGYFVALPLGCGVMAGALVLMACVDPVPALLGGLCLWTFGVCFTWPTLEALASEGEPAGRLQRMIGIYNLVWAGAAALAYFVGGALLVRLGERSIFWLPALLHGVQLAVLAWLKLKHPDLTGRIEAPARATLHPPEHPANPARLRPQAFLILAWLANPFAYMAMNAAVPVIPQLAQRLNLTTPQAGFFCSIWFFARLAAFAALWRWTGWHYRFRWLVAAFLLMIVSFAVLLLVPDLVVIGLAQVTFGLAVGLIYYSSLFYSMDVGETKCEHGGIHEAVIGSGVFAGAAVGSAGQYLLDGRSGGTWAVSFVLALGFGVLLAVRRRLARSRSPATLHFS